MVGIVVVDLRPVEAALVLEAAARAVEGGPPCLSTAAAGKCRAMAEAAAGPAFFTLCTPGTWSSTWANFSSRQITSKAGRPLTQVETGGVDVALLQAEGEDGTLLPLQAHAWCWHRPGWR